MRKSTALLYSLRSKLFISFSLLLLVMLTGTHWLEVFGLPFGSFRGAYNEQLDLAAGQLNIQADTRKQRLLDWLGERRADARQTAENMQTDQAPAALSRQIGSLVAARQVLREAWVVELASRRIVVASLPARVGQALEGMPFVAQGGQPGYREIIDMIRHPDDGRPHLVIARQIGQGGEHRAIRLLLVLLIDTDDIVGNVLESSRELLGSDGEVILVGDDLRILTPLRHSLPDGKPAEVGRHVLAGRTAASAAAGQEGLGEDEDYRGRQVLVAYRHLRLSPDFGWGLLVKRDKESVLSPIHRSLEIYALVSLAGLLLALVATAWLADRLGRPLRELSRVAEQVENGQLDARVVVEVADEAGAVAESFNAMVARLAGWQRDLEAEVERRTHLLQRAIRLYATLSETNQTIVKATDRGQLLNDVCRIAVEFGKLEMAWMYVVDDEADTLAPCCGYRMGQGALDPAWIAGIGASARGCLPAEICLRVDDAVFEDRLQADACQTRWREAAAALGLGPTAAFPIHEAGRLTHVLTLGATEPDFFAVEECALIFEMCRDISYALEAISKDALRKAAEADALRARTFAERIIETANVMVVGLNSAGEIILFNQTAERISGHAKQDVLGRNWFDTLVPRTRFPQVWEVFEAARTGIDFPDTYENPILTASGEERLILWRNVTLTGGDGFQISISFGLDVTEQRAAEAQLRHNAFYDSLTGLPNRALLLDRIGHALERARRGSNHLIAAMFLDLDRFKTINDSLGHFAGDRLLESVAARLVTCIRPGDTASRISGDEFALLIEEMEGPADAIRIAERINESFQMSHEVAGHSLVASASIGIVFGPNQYTQPEEMLRDADIAMYRAKSAGKARYQVFDNEMRSLAVSRLRVESDMRRALERDEFVVYYQPIISLTLGRVAGFEALVRWRHPERGLVLPGEFISIAEDTGLIVDLGMRVMQLATQQLAIWQRRHSRMPPLYMSVNLSARQFQMDNLLARIDDAVTAAGLAPEHVRLEVTESVLMENLSFASSVIQAITQRGYRLYLDDFGTGYSSLSYLHQLPFDALKIDRSFITGMSGSGTAGGIVPSIIGLAHNLGMSVIAEGVETEGQLARLTAQHCDAVQGYYFSRPLPPDGAEALIDALNVLRAT